jgi:hypothetical protein
VKEKAGSQQAFSDRRVLLSTVASVGSLLLGLLASGPLSIVFAQPQRTKSRANFTQADLIPASFPASGQNFWAQTRGPQGGDGIALARNSIGHISVGTQGAGVFRSTDNGENYAGINNQDNWTREATD